MFDGDGLTRLLRLLITSTLALVSLLAFVPQASAWQLIDKQIIDVEIYCTDDPEGNPACDVAVCPPDFHAGEAVGVGPWGGGDKRGIYVGGVGEGSPGILGTKLTTGNYYVGIGC